MSAGAAPSGRLRVRAHPALCEGWGNCHRWAPEVYPLDALVQKLMQIEHFEVHVSEDGSTWTLLHQQSIDYYENPTLTTVLPKPVPARHVRLRAWNAQVAFAGVAELEVYAAEAIFADGFEPMPVTRADTNGG